MAIKFEELRKYIARKPHCLSPEFPGLLAGRADADSGSDAGKIGIPDGRKNKGKMLFHLRRCLSGRKLRQWTVCQKPAGPRYHAPGRPPHSGTSEWYAGKRGGLSSDGGRFRDDRSEKETAEPADRILCRVNSIKNQQKKLNQRLSAENESM